MKDITETPKGQLSVIKLDISAFRTIVAFLDVKFLESNIAVNKNSENISCREQINMSNYQKFTPQNR